MTQLPDGHVSIGKRVKMFAAEEAAEHFDHIADQIEDGSLVISGVPPARVRDRMRDKARAARARRAAAQR